MDCTKSLINEQLHGLPTDIDEGGFNKICQSIQDILCADESERYNAIHRAIVVLDPSAQLEPTQSTSDQAVPQKIGKTDIPKDIFTLFDITPSEDLEFFRSLTDPIEARSLYWYGRVERLLYLSLTMNQHAGNPVDPTQLTAAAYMHDMAMAFLPHEILHKKTQLSLKEKRLIQGHCRVSYDMLHRMCHWEAAAEIVLQHHEQVDAQGYPKGLKDIEICDGAKILAIADAFDAKTHERAYSSLHKRPFIRAILEINRQAGQQFNQKWVNIFNQVMNAFEFSM